jgi:hypothetical protein
MVPEVYPHDVPNSKRTFISCTVDDQTIADLKEMVKLSDSRDRTYFIRMALKRLIAEELPRLRKPPGFMLHVMKAPAEAVPIIADAALVAAAPDEPMLDFENLLKAAEGKLKT